MNKTVILKEDVLSTFKKGKVYGKAGDKVEVISDGHLPLVIVADRKGNRFPVHKNKLINKEQN